MVGADGREVGVKVGIEGAGGRKGLSSSKSVLYSPV